ncbi:MAG: hypothetical protein ABIQ53_10365 [Terracoccus sp.]
MLLTPAGGGNGTGVLVLSGSSGRIESGRAQQPRHGPIPGVPTSLRAQQPRHGRIPADVDLA